MIRTLMFAAALWSGAAMAADLQPFTARYAVSVDGKPQGESVMRLERAGTGWRYRVEAVGTRGVAKLAGFELQQDNRFDVVDGRPRLIEATSSSDALFRHREIRTVFDWQRGQARWEGDVDKDRRGPEPLTPDATNGALLNLMLALDSAEKPPAGQVLRYQQYEKGEAKPVEYVVGTEQVVDTPFGTVKAVALRYDRPQKRKTTTAWYAESVPLTPVRVLQTEDGKAKYELKLLGLQR